MTPSAPTQTAPMTLRPDTAPASSSKAPTEQAVEALVGTRVNKYEVVRVIGRGGMGTVYEALNTAIGKRVAMKFIDAATTGNADAVARFQREAQAASAVESAHIVDIFDSGLSEVGQPYIVMELLRGEDLGHRIKRCGRLDLPEALHVTAQILRGLHRAHNAGIVHRDLKPDNIFLVDRDDDPNFAKILDFGISKVRRGGETPVHTLTRQGTVLGTPFYMSPEQAQAQPDVDARSDLWSVGAILYECLTGRPPYTGATYEQVIVNICMNDAEDVRLYNPAVPEGVAEAIARALSRDRDERYADAREFLDALRSAAGGVMSSRAGINSDDSFRGSSSNNPVVPVSSARSSSRGNVRRTPRPDDLAFDPTVRFQSTPPAKDEPARFSAEERRRLAQRKQRRTFALVAISALLTGGLTAFVIARVVTHPGPHGGSRPPASATPQATSAVVTALPPPPVLSAEPQPPPSSDPAPPPSDSGEPRKGTRPVHSAAPVVVPKTTAKPIETAAPGSTGVAPGLKLKTD